MKSINRMTESSTVSVLQRKKYGIFCKIFCCKCVHCCQSMDFSLLTSENRRGAFFTMIKEYIKSIQHEPNVIIDPFFILLGLLLGEEDEEINAVTLTEIGDGTEKNSIFSKQDLQMYIPQLCTYLVFHQQMKNIPIFNLLERTARFDIQFALLYYSYMKSLQSINQNSQYKVVMKYNKTFKRKIDQHYKFLIDPNVPDVRDGEEHIRKYNNRALTRQKEQTFQKLTHKPQRRLYKVCFADSKSLQDQFGVFGSSINFYNDLVWLGYTLLKVNDRKAALFQYLQQINKKLPADVYLPSKNPLTKGMKVANIVFEECRVFSTKMRAPYYICLQVYEQKQQVDHSKYKRIISTMNMNINQSQLRKSHLFEQDYTEKEQVIKFQEQNKQQKKKRYNIIEKAYRLAKGAKNLYKSNSLKQEAITTSQIQLQTQQQEVLKLFGESQADQQKRINAISPFSELPKHRLVHFMVKTEDDLRQEAFAMQLLQQFNQIFRMEGLSIKVVPYQVIPLGHNCGLIEYLKDSISIDELRKREGSLKFIKKDPIKLKNFLNTLVGYSLVTYFMQIKDRHNGNIMIRKDGSIIHIDYGFFMSNTPGKGVQLEKKIAFKMTNEYIQTLGGLDSKQFSQFRKLFFIGYEACRKHQHRILILVKLMYSSHGTTMPCFLKGNSAIEGLENRLNPPGIRTDGDLSLHCQNLVNNSIDNWRARWYDKWQYYMQGILY